MGTNGSCDWYGMAAEIDRRVDRVGCDLQHRQGSFCELSASERRSLLVGGEQVTPVGGRLMPVPTAFTSAKNALSFLWLQWLR